MTHSALPRLTLERLWQFSLQYYGDRRIKDACLKLQNLYGGNVNLLLLLKWLDEQKLALNKQDLVALNRALQRSETLLIQYRELRRQLKKEVPDSLYRESLQFELLLEKQQQSDLVDCINQLNLSETSSAKLTQIYCEQLSADSLVAIFHQSA
ncbi:hypothetical protein ST37_07925 [Vibrio sp. qd031]|uniref:TIGR02444 family protein n=1 Tax=Vibrio sp. qd031 TaxID=1603038 RepID=UPI000A0F9581|nr:TIGR02444 family protein [Vibrio sp. qd031]ORT50811.1 hypothetical protein ST37_07925 [Vibrio sp. qd031]